MRLTDKKNKRIIKIIIFLFIIKVLPLFHIKLWLSSIQRTPLRRKFLFKLNQLNFKLSKRSLHDNKISLTFFIFNMVLFVMRKGDGFHIKLKIKITVSNAIGSLLDIFNNTPLINKCYSTLFLKISSAMYKGEVFLSNRPLKGFQIPNL